MTNESTPLTTSAAPGAVDELRAFASNLFSRENVERAGTAARDQFKEARRAASEVSGSVEWNAGRLL